MKNIAIIGCGQISKVYSDILINKWNVEPTYVENHPKEIPGRRFYTVEDLLQQEKPDMAIICTPPHLHAKQASKLLDHGVHCLIEKPVATKLEDAITLVKKAKDLGLKLATSSKFRKSNPLQVAKDHIQEIGELKKVSCIFSSPFSLKDNWRSNKEISGGGVWMDNGPHAIDVLETFAGDIYDIQMLLALYAQGFEVEDEVELVTLHNHHVEGSITLSWNRAIDAPLALLKGTEGEINVDWKEVTIIKGGEKKIIHDKGYDKRAAFEKVLDDFMKGPSEDYGASGLRWIETAYSSLKGSKV